LVTHTQGGTRLRVFENRVLRRIFRPKRDEVRGNAENYITRSLMVVFLVQYFSGNESRRMRWAGHVERMCEKRGIYGVLVGNPEGKRPLRRPRHRWENNIKIGSPGSGM